MSDYLVRIENKRAECQRVLEEEKVKDYTSEIDAEVAEYRAQRVEYYKALKTARVGKAENRVEVLDELIATEKAVVATNTGVCVTAKGV